ncbi:MAG: hypothetical protein ACODAE_11350 [Gemmatimonadota bacterium]
MRRRIDMAVAVAEEKLLAAHVDRALAMVARVGDAIPFDDVLDIYTRLLRLSSDEGRALKTRAMAALGQRDGADRAWPEAVEAEGLAGSAGDDGDETGRPSLIARVRRRFRGRINEELRYEIELEAARAEEALLVRHVANAVQFVGLLGEEMPPPEVIDLYIDALDVRESMSEVVYHLALSRLADRHFGDELRPAAVGRTVEPATGSASADALRIVEREGG